MHEIPYCVTRHMNDYCEIARLIKDPEGQMKAAARLLEFEKAAALRDKIVEFRRMMEVEV